MPDLPPLSLYIHLPWCVRKCPYCDFNSHAAGGSIDEAGYVEALLADLEDERVFVQGRKLQSIFFGGGTPSLFSPDSIAILLQACEQQTAFANDIEITMEANPGTFEQQKFSGFYQAGINRLSIGIQSFNASHLQALGRIHDDCEAHRAVDIAKQAGFDNINLDLMYALPGQDIAQALHDVQQACDKHVQHISHYQLTIEPNTRFHKYPPQQPDNDSLWQMQRDCQLLLATHGYRQYEVSAYARADRACRHNLNYWRFGDYLGIGAGAHGKITHGDHVIRRWKKRQPSDYMRAAMQHKALSGSREIAAQDIVFEFLMNALRLREGISPTLFTQRTGLGIDVLKQACADIDSELLVIDDSVIRTTEYGYRFIDDILQRLL